MLILFIILLDSSLSTLFTEIAFLISFSSVIALGSVYKIGLNSYDKF